jgi:putative transposase
MSKFSVSAFIFRYRLKDIVLGLTTANPNGSLRIQVVVSRHFLSSFGFMRLSYKVEIQPTPTQRQAMLRHAGTARWSYNWGLAQHKKTYEEWVIAGKPKKWNGWKNYFSLHKDLVILKKTDLDKGGVPWMYESSKCAPQEALVDLDRAFKNFLSGRARYPKFKSKKNGIGGFRLTGTIKADKKSIQLPIIGRVRIKPGDHGYIPFGRYAQVSVSEKIGRWFVSVVSAELPEAPNNGKPAVGLDLGIAQLATISDGTTFENPRALKKSQKKLTHLQKELSRKKKGSKNRAKAKHKFAKTHYRIANIRKDTLHKVTTAVTKNHGTVVIEDLQVKNMIKSGGVYKKGLNQSLSDVAFGEFRRVLEYKGRKYGCNIVAVPAAYTSQRCSSCGHTEKANRKLQSEFMCISCGFKINADLNAAINILVAGSCPETQNACGENIRLSNLRVGEQISMKQESAVA